MFRKHVQPAHGRSGRCHSKPLPPLSGTTGNVEPCKPNCRRAGSKESVFSDSTTVVPNSRMSTTSFGYVESLHDDVSSNPDGTWSTPPRSLTNRSSISSLVPSPVQEQQDHSVPSPQGESQNSLRKAVYHNTAQAKQTVTSDRISVFDVHDTICEVSVDTEVAYICSPSQAKLIPPSSTIVKFTGENPCKFPEKLNSASAVVLIVEDCETCFDKAVDILRSDSESLTGFVSALLMGSESSDFRDIASRVADLMEAGADDVVVLPRERNQLRCAISVSLVKADVRRQQEACIEKKLAAARKQCHRLFWQVSHEVLQGMPELRENLQEVHGESIGNITVLGRLGSGSSCEVFLCRNSAKDKSCAVKVFKKHDIKSIDQLSQLVLEYECLKKLKHANIAAAINLVHGTQCVYLFMEMVGTTNLFQTIKSQGGQGLPWLKAKEVLLHIFCGVTHMHGKEVAHCDLKPENIVLSQDGCAKLIDFGQAISLDDIPPLESPRGTMPFMSPEMVRLGEGLDLVAADLWSLGVILVEVLCGNHTFSQLLGWKRSINTMTEMLKCADELALVFAKQSKDNVLQGIVDLCEPTLPSCCVRSILAGLIELDTASRMPAKLVVANLEDGDDSMQGYVGA